MVCGKKGQITLFVIIGIIILLVAGVFIYTGNRVNGSDFVDSILDGRNDRSLEGYVQSCMSTVGKDAVMQITLQGGYYELELPYFNAYLLSSPYYLNEGLVENIPSIDTVESNLAKYVFANLHSCVGEFTGVKNYELINMTAPTIDVHIEADGVTFVVDYDAYFNDGDNIKEIQAVTYKYPVRIPTYLNISKLLVESYLYDREVNYDDLLEISGEYNIDILTFDYGNSMSFVLVDKNKEYYFEDDKPVIYTFAIEGGMI
ncbi:hypothetical protein JXA48_02030 [Candidatus Woesearchaeota archaeon]|nr:hypothetical protein [Candidatus Woesearchaeota archaeon]